MTFGVLVLFALAFCTVGMVQAPPSQVVLKPLSWFKPDARQARKDFGTEEELRRLGEDLKRKQLQPLVSLEDGRLVAGERRLQAALLVGMTHLEVKILEWELTDTQIRVYQLCENLQRKDLTAYEKWLGCVDLLSINPHWQLRDLAEALHLDPSSATRLMSPSRCIPAWQEALKEGTVGISDCYAASKLPETEQAGMLALKRSGASRDALEVAGRKKRNGGNGTVQAVKVNRVKCPLPTGVTVTLAGNGDGLSLDKVIESLVDLLKAARKANDDGLDARTFQAVLRDKSKVGG